jgi:rare lipoprotein A
VLGGVAPVEVVRITHDEIRAGLWQRGTAGSGSSSGARGSTVVPPPAAALPPAVGDDPLGAMLVDRGLAPPPAMPRR